MHGIQVVEVGGDGTDMSSVELSAIDRFAGVPALAKHKDLCINYVF